MTDRFSISLSWEDAPGVAHPLQALTWCSLTIDIADHCITKVESRSSSSIRRNIYCSALPLFEWLADNWWFIFGESLKIAKPISDLQISGRSIASKSKEYADWIKRHDFLAAREGGSLPDLILCRDGDVILARWSPDPDASVSNSARPVSFLSEGLARLDTIYFRDEMTRFMNSVMERIGSSNLYGMSPAPKQWEAIQSSTTEEIHNYLALASFGVDPFDASDETDAILHKVEELRKRLGDDLAGDLFEATNVQSLDEDWNYVNTALGLLEIDHGDFASGLDFASDSHRRAISAHLAGYERAEELRGKLQLPVLLTDEQLEESFYTLMGKTASIDHIESAIDVQSSNIEAVVGSSCGQPRVVARALATQAKRFRMGRCLHQFAYSKASRLPRLVTKSRTWEQRASRAFAAELLAPSSELRKFFGKETDSDQIQSVAQEFRVSYMVIQYQIENHCLSVIGDL